MAKKGKKIKKDAAVLKKPETIKKIKDPDPNSDDFMYDAGDQFHNQKEKILLGDDSGASSDDDDVGALEEDTEEVYALTSDDQSEDDSAAEESEEDDEEPAADGDLTSDKAWGRGKKAFYDADLDDEDVYANDEEAREAVAEEEREAITLQKRMQGKLSEEDFASIEVSESSTAQDEEPGKEDSAALKKDISALSARERVQLFVKDSPEYLGLLEEFKERMDEVVKVYTPLMKLIKAGKITSKQGQEYVILKHSLLTNYCVNLSFYFQLKVCKERVTNHPVIQRMMQHQQLLKKLDGVDKRLRTEMNDLIKAYEADLKSAGPIKAKEQRQKVEMPTKTQPSTEAANEGGKLARKRNKKRKKQSIFEDDSDEGEGKPSIDPLEYYNKIKIQTQAKKNKKSSLEAGNDELVEEGEEQDPDSKRSITYKMQKNKGLIRQRKKELRNPRIKHKMKFQKAKIKHKSQVREVKTEMQRYGGETTGIKTSLARSVKLQS